VARTSLSSPKPKVTVRARVRAAIHRTCGSSPFSTAAPPGAEGGDHLRLLGAVRSRVPKLSQCSLATDVTTTTSGHRARACRRICPGPLMPTSKTACRRPGDSRRTARATAARPLRSTVPPRAVPSTARTARVVVVFPRLPTTATIRVRRMSVRRCSRARVTRRAHARSGTAAARWSRPSGVASRRSTSVACTRTRFAATATRSRRRDTDVPGPIRHARRRDRTPPALERLAVPHGGRSRRATLRDPVPGNPRMSAASSERRPHPRESVRSSGLTPRQRPIVARAPAASWHGCGSG
jgi:hypothetical protein